MEDVTNGGIPSCLPSSGTDGTQVRLAATGPMDDSGNILLSNDTQEFGSRMLVTRRRSRGHGRGASFSSARGSHVRQGVREETIHAGDSSVRHVDGLDTSGRTRGGHYARGGIRGGFSHSVSARLAPSSMPLETSFGLEPNVSRIPDDSETLSPSHVIIPVLESDNSPVSQVPIVELQSDSRDSPGPSKPDKKGKDVLIEASGSVSGQLFSTALVKKSKQTVGSSFPVEESERSPTLLMNIVDQPHKPDKVLDLHQRAVENLESILSEDDVESEGSDCSMSESDEYDEDLEMEDDVDDSTILSMYQEGLRIENLVRKGSVLSTMSQKKGRLGASEDGDPVRVSRGHSTSD